MMPRSVRDAPLLSVANLDAGYGSLQILYGMALDLYAAEQLLVFGPNGAGKSTLVKALLGIVMPTSGSVVYQGRSIFGLATESVIRRGVGYVPQVDNVFGSMTVAEYLEMGGAPFASPAPPPRCASATTSAPCTWGQAAQTPDPVRLPRPPQPPSQRAPQRSMPAITHFSNA